MDEQVFAPFKGAVEPPARDSPVVLHSRLRLVASIFGGLAIIIIAVAAIVS